MIGGQLLQTGHVKQNVLFDGRYIQDRYHGIGRYAFHLVDELAGLLPDLPVTLLRDSTAAESRFNWAALSSHPNVYLRHLPARVFSLREQVAVPSSIYGRPRRDTLYHTPYFALPWLPLLARSIVTVHDCIFERDARYMPRRWARLYYRLLMHASTKRATYVAVPSRATARDLQRFYRVPSSKIIVTPEAADRTFRPLDEGMLLARTAQKYKLPERFVLAVGARRPHKNFAHLVHSVRPIEDAHLVFVGDADERFQDDTARVAESLGGRAHFVGNVLERDLPALYNLAAVVACPSLVEGFGLPVLEAMSCGTPVVCSDIPVFREVAGRAAIYAPPDDVDAWTKALNGVLGSPVVQADLKQRALEHARHFSWRAAAEALVPAYLS